jgi:hypothetical protein
MATNSDTKAALPHFDFIPRIDVPNGRDGKHKKIVLQLLSEIDQLGAGLALKIPLAALPDVKENIRAALNRATHRRGLNVATSSDAEFLYVWKVEREVSSDEEQAV